MIKDFKRKNCGERCIDLEPWDEAYYTGMMKTSAHNLDSKVSNPFSVCCRYKEVKNLNFHIPYYFFVGIHSLLEKRNSLHYSDKEFKVLLSVTCRS